MVDIKNSHDKLFKETLSDISNARDYFRHYLPANILNIINLDTLEIRKDSFIDEELKEFFSDMLYSVQFGKKAGYIYLLLEHKSFFDKDTPLKLLEYMVKIWKLHISQHKLPLPVIVPLVLYHGKDKWNIGNRFSELIDKYPARLKEYMPDFSYSLFDLSKWTDAEIKGGVVLQAMLLLFKYIFDKKFLDKLPDIAILFGDIIEKERGLEAMEALFRYISGNVEKSVEELNKVLFQSLPKGKEDIIMTLADQLRNEGMQQGMQQGMQRGIIDILQVRFNSVPDILMQRLNSIKDPEQLRNINKKAVIVNSISELTPYLN
ncbi:MAG: Rpn family recombination-promoting nuclease/putative transposase [Deltaproteobacteria bacterium]|nr:Rpn family recombination-promoting nuclease/putative transposase [Deltaproteobacteria bacterium]